MKETDALDEYILQHIDEESDYLKALYRATHVKLLRPRMASGHLQGRMLKMFVPLLLKVLLNMSSSISPLTLKVSLLVKKV